MGISELIVIIIIGGLIFSPVARDGYITGFIEGFTGKYKK